MNPSALIKTFGQLILYVTLLILFCYFYLIDTLMAPWLSTENNYYGGLFKKYDLSGKILNKFRTLESYRAKIS